MMPSSSSGAADSILRRKSLVVLLGLLAFDGCENALQ